MTNGEKMISAFPNGEVRKFEKGVVFSTGGWCHAYAEEWWNAECEEPTTKNNLGVDCISRKAALDITWQDPSYSDPLNVLTEVRDKIRELPSVTPQEPRKGQWIEHFDESGKWYECDQCHTDWGGAVNFCPDCGADMREVEE